jgi:hypothetical protein
MVVCCQKGHNMEYKICITNPKGETESFGPVPSKGIAGARLREKHWLEFRVNYWIKPKEASLPEANRTVARIEETQEENPGLSPVSELW